MNIPRTKKKGGSKLLIFILIILIIASLRGGYLYIIKSPQYSLYKITKAVENNDLEDFEKYVDIDRTVTQLVDQILEREVKKFSFGSVKLEEELVKKVRPKIIKYIKDEIELFVLSGNIKNRGASNTDIPAINFHQELGLKYLEYKKIEKVEKHDNVAVVSLDIYHKRFKKHLKPKIKMKMVEDYWRVCEIRNIDSSLLIIEKLVNEKIEELSRPVKDWLNKMLPSKLRVV